MPSPPSGIIRKLWWFFRWLSYHTGLIAGGLTLVMMVAIMREVVGRYFFNSPSDWSLELSGYLLVAMAYLGAAHTEFEDGNIRIDFIYARFKGRPKAAVDAFICLIGACWSAVIGWQGLALAEHSWGIGARSSEAMAWPLFPSQILIPIGAFLLCLVFIGKLILSIEKLTKEGH